MDLLDALVMLLSFAVAHGAQMALGAFGVTLIHGILRFSNVAPADTLAVATARPVAGPRRAHLHGGCAMSERPQREGPP